MDSFVTSTPSEVLMIVDGFHVNEFPPWGRRARSMTFLSAPGIERLYSGVTASGVTAITASTTAKASLNAFATGGNPGPRRGNARALRQVLPHQR
ncbi:MAG TPA: hypothetical protein VK022_00355 [Paracoccaceae bacterium]|nr:hypothetical protein [Paracoccaceae bacterium]